jgi:hypothetical protein
MARICKDRGGKLELESLSEYQPNPVWEKLHDDVLVRGPLRYWRYGDPREANLEVLAATMSCPRDTPLLARPTWVVTVDRETETFSSHFGYDNRLQTSKTSVRPWSYPRYPYMAIGRL